MLLATAACNFSTSQLQKMLRDRQFFNILTWKCASRHSGVQFSTSQLQKVLRTPQFFNILTWKCASRHSGVQFFDISTSKSGPNLTCFVHFYLKMRFSPQRRTIFRHLNFKKWSEHAVFCTFLLENALLATAACNFSTSQLQSGPSMQCFVHFYLKMCFSPQRRALFDFSSDHMTPHPPL